MTQVAPVSPVALNVFKELGGKRWVNSYVFHCPATVDASVRVGIGVDTLAAILVDFEKRLYFEEVTIQDVYVGDANEQPPNPFGPNGSYYQRVSFNVLGSRVSAGGNESITPLSVAVLVRLQAALQRGGFKFYRGMLEEGSITAGGDIGTVLTTAAALPALDGVLQAALTASTLRTYLEGGTNAGTAVLIAPKYRILEGTTQRLVVSGTLVKSMAVARLTIRRVTRNARTRRRGKNEV